MTFLRLLDIEIRKTFKHPALWLGLLATFLLLGMFTLVSHLQITRGLRTGQGGLEKELLAGLAFYNWIGVLVYAVIGAVIAGFDYQDRTLQLWLGRGVGRPALLSVWLVTMLFFGLLVVCYAVASLLAFGAISRLLLFGALESSYLETSALPSATLRIFWSGMPYLALALLLAVVSRSPQVTAAGTIAYGSVFEMLAMQAGGRFPWLIRYLPASLSRALQASNAALDRAALAVDAALMTPPQAMVWIGVIFCALSAAALIVFLRQDLGG